jgi:hypothetical protein
MLAGFIIGIGTMVKGTFLTLLPPIIFYLLFYPKNKHIFSLKDVLYFLLVIGAVILPNIYWEIKNSFTDFQYHYYRADFFSFSLIPTSLFLGEIIVVGMRNFPDSIFYWIFSYEYPFLNWLMGLICISGAIYFLKNKKNDFISLLLWEFFFIFIFFSCVRAKTGGGYYFHLDNFWWAVLAVIPGFILGSAMLTDLSNRHKIFRFILPLLILYFIINTIIFITFPANCFIPRDSIKANELFHTAENYLQEGKKDKALKVYDYINKHYPDYVK